MALTALTAGGLAPCRHAFFGRTGGVSEGYWASLNMGLRSADEPARVRSNRALAARHLGLEPAALVTARQVHGACCVTVEEAWRAEEAPEADALVTARPGILLGVLSADCAPLLLADATARVVGAAHAGWKGALAGVVEAVIAGMRELGAEPARIAAAVGPCIGRTSYEVGPEFQERFLAADPANARHFHHATGAGRPFFDLEGYVAARARAAGIERVDVLGVDTCAEELRFFSNRRAFRRGEPAFGLQLSAIAVPR